MASLTVENYVKAIYQINTAGGGEPAATGQIATSLGVSPGTVTSMLKTLSDSHLATYTPYEGVLLTEAGNALALRVVRRHRLIELFLVKTLDLSGDLPPELSFLTLEPVSLVLSAVKRSEQGERLIVRFYNPTAVPVQAAVRLFRPIRSAQVVNLNEEPQEDLAVDGEDGVTVSVVGKGIMTLALQV